MITNRQSGTNVHEIADGIFRINTPIAIEGAGAFSFNQFLIADDEPLLFHTGPRRLFPLVREAVASVLPVANLRYIGFSHVEADECGSLNEWLAAAPQSVPLCGTIAATVSIGDLADRALVMEAGQVRFTCTPRELPVRLGWRSQVKLRMQPGVLAQLGVNGNVSAEHGLQSADHIADHTARAHGNTANNTQAARDAHAGDFKGGSDKLGIHNIYFGCFVFRCWR